MRDIYARYPDGATDDLIVAIIDAMSAWFSDKRNEPYCRTLYLAVSMADPDIQSRYKRYRLRRIRERDRAGAADLLPPGNVPYSMADYIAANYPPLSLDLYRGALIGTFYTLDLIACGFSTIYHPEDRLHHFFGEPFIGHARIKRVARKRKAGRAQLHFPHTPASFFDAGVGTPLGQALYRLLVLIFRYLRDNGYDWQFRSDTLGIAKFAEDRGYALGNTFEGEYFEEVAEPPAMEVEAYHEVYGKLPDGYPPRLDDYGESRVF